MLDNLKLLFIWAPVMNVQLILDGIFIGAVFALTAYGLALVWGVMNIKNLAQGDFVIMGGVPLLRPLQCGISSAFDPAFGNDSDVWIWMAGLRHHHPQGYRQRYVYLSAGNLWIVSFNATGDQSHLWPGGSNC